MLLGRIFLPLSSIFKFFVAATTNLIGFQKYIFYGWHSMSSVKKKEKRKMELCIALELCATGLSSSSRIRTEICIVVWTLLGVTSFSEVFCLKLSIDISVRFIHFIVMGAFLMTTDGVFGSGVQSISHICSCLPICAKQCAGSIRNGCMLI